MSEKLLESITLKCTLDEKEKANGIWKAKNFTSLSEYIRSLLIADISQTEEFVKLLAKSMRLNTDTADTFHLELVPQSMIDVTPKYTGVKKAQLLEQLDFLSIHNLSHE